MSKFGRGDEAERSVQLFEGSARLPFPALFPQYQGLIIIISLGALESLSLVKKKSGNVTISVGVVQHE